MASHEGSRKRLKVSRTEEKSINTNMPPVASSSKTPSAIPAKQDTPAIMLSAAEQTLTTLNTDIEAMRQLVTCKICDRLLYEPYSLSCGHTYCYSCLSQWLVSNRKKTCPDCRAITTQQPTPCYVIRELVLIFVSRNQLLPDGETSEEHHKLAREEAKIVADDKANKDPVTGGLFKGCFSRARARPLPIHDPGDGVDRCPECHWEMEGDQCAQCGFDLEDHFDRHFDPYFETDFEDMTDLDSQLSSAIPSDGEISEDDHGDYFGTDDFDGEGSTVNGDEVAEYMAMHGAHNPRGVSQSSDGYANHRRRRNGPTIDLISSDNESEDDDEHDPTMRDFVVDDDGTDAGANESGEDTDVPEVTRARRIRQGQRPIQIEDDSDAPSDSDDEPVQLGSQRANHGRVPVRPRRIVVPTSDEEDDDSSDDNDGDGESTVDGQGGFSPIDGGVEDDHEQYSSVAGHDDWPRFYGNAGEGMSQQSGYESDHTAAFDTASENGGYASGEPNAFFPVSEVEEDSDDESDGSEDEDDEGWDTRSETPRATRNPPQTSSHRLGTLGQHSNRHIDAHRTNASFFGGQQPSRSLPSSLRGHPGAAAARTAQRRTPARLPAHPFQLGNALNGINYNQRNQQVRSQPTHRINTSVGSSRSSNGGVGVQSSGGSSETLRGDAQRRKRQLSISSDVSYE